MGELLRLRVDDEIELVLREVENAEAIFALIERNRARLEEWLIWPSGVRDLDATQAYLRRCIEDCTTKKQIALGIRYRGEWVGGVSLYDIVAEDRRAEIGYWLCETAEGRGIVTRAVRRLVEYAFDELHLHRVSILFEPPNERSRKVAENLGFIYEATLADYHFLNGNPVDRCVYRLLATERDRMNESRR